MTPATFFVYVDYRVDTHTPFYVGKGLAPRLKSLKRNQKHTNIANKHGQRRVVAYEFDNEADASAKEIELIAGLQTRDTFGGSNFTDGGDGRAGGVHSEETRAKMSTSQRERIAQQNPEVRAKLSASRRAVWQDPEVRAKHSAAAQDMWQDPEYRAKHSASMRVTRQDPEVRAKRSASMRVAWQDPEYQAKHSASVRVAWQDPEVRAKHLAALQDMWQDPEYRAKHSASMRDLESRAKMRISALRLSIRRAAVDNGYSSFTEERVVS